MRLSAVALLLWSLPAFGQQQLVPNPLQQDGWRPIPDPTLLTTQAQEKAIAALRELIDARFKSLGEELKVEREARDLKDARTIKRLDEFPAMIDVKLLSFEQLVNEKFKGIASEFQGRDVALAAALLSQKTLVDEQNKANAISNAKTEATTIKQIDSILAIIAANQKANDDREEGTKALIGNQTKSLDDKINDVRNTITDLRTSITSISSREAGHSNSWAWAVAGVGVLIGVFGLLPKLSASAHPPDYRYAYYPQPQPQPQPQVSVVPVVPVNMPQNRGNQT